MSKGLIKLASADATGQTTVELRGLTTDFNVGLLTWNNVQPTLDNKNVMFYFTKTSGGYDNTANYTNALWNYNSTASATVSTGTGATQVVLHASMGNATGETGSGEMWLFNFADSNEWSHIILETICLNLSNIANSYQGGNILQVTGSNDGIHFFVESAGTFASGNFVLYGLKP